MRVNSVYNLLAFSDTPYPYVVSGIMGDKGMIPPFQVPAVAGAAPSMSWSVFNEDGTETIISSDKLRYDSSADKAFVTYMGTEAQGELCGPLHIKITIDGVIYYSEWFYLNSFTYKENYYKLEVWNSVSKPDVLYQTGYKQKVYFEAHVDAPELVENNEFITNLKDKNFLSKQSVKERLVFKLPNLPDSILVSLKGLNSHDNVKLTSLETGEVFVMEEIEFTSEVISSQFSEGTLSFLAAHGYSTGCDENIELTILDSNPIE